MTEPPRLNVEELWVSYDRINAVRKVSFTVGAQLLPDEPSMGVAPLLVREIFQVIQRLNRQGTAILWGNRTPSWPWRSPTGPISWRLGKSP